MTTDSEIAYSQALDAVLGAAQELGLDVDQLATKAKGLLLDHSPYRKVEHPHVTNACAAIDEAAADVSRHRATFQTEVKAP